MLGKSRNSFADVLFMPVLMALMPPTICCVKAQSVRDFVTELRLCLAGNGAVWLRAL